MSNTHLSIKPGERQNLLINVGELANGAPINLPVMVASGTTSGPTLVTTGAIHGDEVVGTEAAKVVASHLDPRKMKGTVITIPVLNIFAYLFVDRVNILEVPSGSSDMSRYMKSGGDPLGTPTQSIVYWLENEVLPKASAYLELHSSAKWSNNYPRSIIAPTWAPIKQEIKDMEEKLALASGFEVIIRPKEKKWPGQYFEMDAKFQEKWGIPHIVLETGCAPTIDDVDTMTHGIQNIIRQLGIVDEPVEKPTLPPGRKQTFMDTIVAVRANKGGMLRLRKGVLGQYLKKGEVFGEITNLFNETVEQLTTPVEGLMIKIATSAICFSGTRVAVVATPYR